MAVDFDATVLAAAEQVFAETVTWYPGWSGPAVVQGIFNDRFHETRFQDATEVVELRPVLNARVIRFTRQPVQGELFRIRGVLYAVTNVEPDGVGDLRMYLRLASNEEAARLPLPPS